MKAPKNIIRNGVTYDQVAVHLIAVPLIKAEGVSSNVQCVLTPFRYNQDGKVEACYEETYSLSFDDMKNETDVEVLSAFAEIKSALQKLFDSKLA